MHGVAKMAFKIFNLNSVYIINTPLLWLVVTSVYEICINLFTNFVFTLYAR